MGVFHRKLILPSSNGPIADIKYPCIDFDCSNTYCPPQCFPKDDDGDDDDDGDSLLSYPPPFPPPVLPPPPPALDPLPDQYQILNPNPDQKHQVSPIVIIIIVILASCFLLVSYYAIIVKYCGSWRDSRRRRRAAQNQPPEETHEDFIDENHGPIIDHPIWLITTVGLEQSIINAITVFKYKKGEGLIEGTECSVCLNEFHEDESLRLLPKCSHAFHIPCIDTWLRSHKNCPLCRAPIVSNPPVIRATSTVPIVPISNSSDSREETLVENSESDDGLEGNQQMVNESRIGVEDERELQPLQDSNRRDINVTKEIVPCPPPNNGFRGLSDLGDNHRISTENGIQPVRRSVSMDISMFCLSVPNSVPAEGGSSNGQPIIGKDTNSLIVPKTPSMSPSIFRLMGSSSIGGFLQRGPVSMKRSFSSGGKLSRSSRSQCSNLPL